MAGRKSKFEPSRSWHRTPLRVPLFEVDLGQAVYHGNYFHLLELGREAFLRDLGYSYRRFMDQQLHLTIVESSCSYRRPLLYDDQIEIQTRVEGWRSRSLVFSQAVCRREATGGLVLCTEATLHMVCVRFSGQPAVLPPEFVDLLKNWFDQTQEKPMATQDKCCSIVPYFKIHSGKLELFKQLCERFVAKSAGEPECLYYGFSFAGNLAHCREGYANAEAALAHLENVGALLEEALTIADLARLEIHGPETELAKLREPLAKLNPQVFVLEYGFRR